MLCLLALALPLQGAAAAMAAAHAQAHPASHTMTMPDGTVMDGAAMPHATSDGAPCPHHAVDKAGCGPAATQQPQLSVTPVAPRWAPTARAVAQAATPVFLTGGPDRPPRLA